MDWRDAVERACDDFAPVRDERTSSQAAVVFTRFKDGHGTEVTVHLSSAATRECCWVSLDLPPEVQTFETHENGHRQEALHMCRCMAAELYDALNRAFGGTLATQPHCQEADR